MDYFNPRTPYGMRRSIWFVINHNCIISIHAPLTGCDSRPSISSSSSFISIHAPLTGCDKMVQSLLIENLYFNPRTPYGMRQYMTLRCSATVTFQSTHPLRDATQVADSTCDNSNNFNPRTPYGMRLTVASDTWSALGISIHAPLTGCDRYEGYH